MKSEFELLNNAKINMEEYEEIRFDDNSNFKKKMTDKLKARKKKSYKRSILTASLAAIVSIGFISNEKVWAYVESIWHTIDDISKAKQGEIKDYRYYINKVVEDKNVKVLFRSIMLDDGKLIIDANIDDTNFNPFKDFTENQQQDWFVDEWGNKETVVSLGADCTEIYVDGIKFSDIISMAPNENKRNTDGTTNILIDRNLDAIEADEENMAMKKIRKDEFPYTIDENKTYNFKIKINKIHLVQAELTEGELKEQGGRYGGAIRGDWSIDVDIKGKDLINSSTEHKINQDITLNADDIIVDLNLKNLNVSPLYVSLYYSYLEKDGYNVEFKVYNDKNEEYQCISMGPSEISEDCKPSNMEVKMINSYEDVEYIKIVPAIVDYDKKKTFTFDKQAIKVQLNK